LFKLYGIASTLRDDEEIVNNGLRRFDDLGEDLEEMSLVPARDRGYPFLDEE
jgi:hypothetical protein